MEIFLISFVAIILMCLALGIGIIFRGHPLRAGCRNLATGDCRFRFVCGRYCPANSREENEEA